MIVINKSGRLYGFCLQIPTQHISRLMYLTNAFVTVRRTRSEVNNCKAVLTTGLFGKFSYLGTLYKCLLDHCDSVPTTHVYLATRQTW
jgi:hypothetical protein